MGDTVVSETPLEVTESVSLPVEVEKKTTLDSPPGFAPLSLDVQSNQGAGLGDLVVEKEESLEKVLNLGDKDNSGDVAVGECVDGEKGSSSGGKVDGAWLVKFAAVTTTSEVPAVETVKRKRGRPVKNKVAWNTPLASSASPTVVNGSNGVLSSLVSSVNGTNGTNGMSPSLASSSPTPNSNEMTIEEIMKRKERKPVKIKRGRNKRKALGKYVSGGSSPAPSSAPAQGAIEMSSAELVKKRRGRQPKLQKGQGKGSEKAASSESSLPKKGGGRWPNSQNSLSKKNGTKEPISLEPSLSTPDAAEPPRTQMSLRPTPGRTAGRPTIPKRKYQRKKGSTATGLASSTGAEMEPVQNEIEPIIQQNLDHNAWELHTHDIGHPPTNPADRRRLVFFPPPHDNEFSDSFVAKVIGHNCVDGWPTPAILWKETPQLFRDRAWEDFTKRFTWDPSIDSKIKEMYVAKCKLRTKGNLNKARKRAMKAAEKYRPGEGEEYMRLFHPWFTTPEVWAQMCQRWRDDPDFRKRSQVAKANRVAGQPSGVRAKGTYRGGTKAQVHYMMEQESQFTTEGEGETPKDFVEMYVSLRSNLPGVVEHREEYLRLMHEKYPEATGTLPFDEEVWTKVTVQKKGYVKGIGQKRTRPNSFSECTSAFSVVGQSTATSVAPNIEQQAQDIIQAICQNPSLMEQLRSTFISCFQPNGVQVAQGQSSHVSGNHGP